MGLLNIQQVEKFRKTASHIVPQTVYVHNVHTREQSEK